MFELSIIINGEEKKPKQLFLSLLSAALAFFQPETKSKDELALSKMNAHDRYWHLSDMLFDAITHGHDKGVLRALELGADPNSYDMYDDMPLHLAVLPEYKLGANTIRALLDAGAKVNYTNASGSELNCGCTPFSLFASHLPYDREMNKNEIEIAYLLLERGAITDTIHIERQEVPIHLIDDDDYGAPHNEMAEAFPWIDTTPAWAKPETATEYYVLKPLDYVQNPVNRKKLEEIIKNVADRKTQETQAVMRHTQGRVVQEQALIENARNELTRQ